MYDTETKLKLKETYTEKTPRGDFNIIQEFADYKAINGVLMPHALSGKQGPQPMSMTLKTVTVNNKKTEIFSGSGSGVDKKEINVDSDENDENIEDSPAPKMKK